MAYDTFQLAIAALSDGKNEVLFDDLGNPSVMVRIDKMYCDELIPGMPHEVHPAFLVGGREVDCVYVSKYPNIIRDGRAYSLPLVHPTGFLTQDTAVEVSRAKGPGWGLIPVSLWSALALRMRRDGFAPRGNNARGSARHYPNEQGIVTGTESGLPSETATGSGPLTWYHDRTASGLADLVGNVSEWNAGMRLCRGELQIVPNADCMLQQTSLKEDSDAWRAILPDGTLVVPGSREDTLKIDMENGRWKISTRVTSAVDDARGGLFRDMFYDPAELPNGVPDVLKLLTVYPAEEDRSSYAEDLIFANNWQQERICLRGGNWSSGPHSGLFYYAMDAKRNRQVPRLGFRSVYYPI